MRKRPGSPLWRILKRNRQPLPYKLEQVHFDTARRAHGKGGKVTKINALSMVTLIGLLLGGCGTKEPEKVEASNPPALNWHGLLIQTKWPHYSRNVRMACRKDISRARKRVGDVMRKLISVEAITFSLLLGLMLFSLRAHAA